MKHSSIKISGFLLGFFILALMLVNESDAKSLMPRSKGEFCIQSENGGIARLFVTNMGNKHYIVNGVVAVEDGRVEALFGSAEVKDGKVYMTITSSGSNDSDTWSSTGYVVLDASTLNGTVESMDIDHDKTNPDPKSAEVSHNGPETLTRVNCP